MDEKDEKEKPFLNNISDNSELLEKKDEEMRDTYEKYCKLLNKMKKNVENMGSNKLMNYQNLFNDFNNDIIKFNEEEKKLLKLKDDLNEETNLPDKIKKNLDRVNKDFENNKKIIEKLKLKVEEYKEKYKKKEKKKLYEIEKETSSSLLLNFHKNTELANMVIRKVKLLQMENKNF